MKSNAKKLDIIIIFMLIVFGGYLYIQHMHNSSYRIKALQYIKEFDNTQMYNYIGESQKECHMLGGCEVKVYLQGNVTGEKITILILNGRVAPIAKAITDSR